MASFIQPHLRPLSELAKILNYLNEVRHAGVSFDAHLLATIIAANVLPLSTRSYQQRQCKREGHATSTRFENFVLGFQGITADAIDALLRNHKVPGDRPLETILKGEEGWFASIKKLIDEVESKVATIASLQKEMACACFQQDLNILAEIMGFLRKELDAILPGPCQDEVPLITAEDWQVLKHQCRACYLRSRTLAPGPAGWSRLKISLAAVAAIMTYVESRPQVPMSRLVNNGRNSLWSLETVESLLTSHPMTLIQQTISPHDPCFEKTKAMRGFALYDIHARLQRLMDVAKVRNRLQASSEEAKPEPMLKLLRQIQGNSVKLEGSRIGGIKLDQLKGAMQDIYSLSDHPLPSGSVFGSPFSALFGTYKRARTKSAELAKSFSKERPSSPKAESDKGERKLSSSSSSSSTADHHSFRGDI